MRAFTAEDRDRMEAIAPLAQAGDAGAREELGELALVMVSALIRSRRYWVPGMTERDLVQEAAAGIMHDLRRWKPEETPFAPYAWMVATCDVIQAIRTAHGNRQRALNEAQSLDEVVSAPASRRPLTRYDMIKDQVAADQSETATTVKEADMIVEALKASASALEQAVIERLWVQGMEYRDAAAAIGRTKKALDNAVQRMRPKAAEVVARLADDERFTPETREMMRRALDGYLARGGRKRPRKTGRAVAGAD